MADPGSCGLYQRRGIVRGRWHGAAPLWYVAAFPDAPCRSALSLGRVPARFAADKGAPPLRLVPGQLYRAEVTGSGFIAAARFTFGG